MARKSIKNNNDDGTTSQNNTASETQNAQVAAKTDKRSPLVYVVIIAMVILVIAIAYYALYGSGGHSLTSKQILSDISNSSLNKTQALFVNDLKKSENVSDLHVSYYSSNATEYVTQTNNLTIAISSNQTLDSYKLGSYNRSAITSIATYTNSKNGEVIAKNVSSLYYYNTNTTLICFNDTTYSSGLITNSSLKCANGDQGLSYIEETPFTAANVSVLGYLVFNATITYGGIKTIDGRSCDSFIISNATSANLQSNYSVFNLCLDTQYGIPLYFNQTDVVGGVPSSFVITATAFSLNASRSEFVILQQYLNAIRHSII